MVGGRTPKSGQFNLATEAAPPGRAARSSRSRWPPPSSRDLACNSMWNGPAVDHHHRPAVLTRTARPGRSHNYADESGGTMNLLDATAHSVNTIFAQLVVQVGPRPWSTWRTAWASPHRLQPVCSITLGIAGGDAARHGRRVRHARRRRRPSRAGQADRQVTRARRARRSFKRRRAKGDAGRSTRTTRTWSTYALERVVTDGTGTAAAIGPAGGRQDRHRAELRGRVVLRLHAAARDVRVGRVTRRARCPMTNVEGFPDVFGGSIPALIWHDFMAKAMADHAREGLHDAELHRLQHSPARGPWPRRRPRRAPRRRPARRRRRAPHRQPEPVTVPSPRPRPSADASGWSDRSRAPRSVGRT